MDLILYLLEAYCYHRLMQALIRNGANPNFQSKDQRRTAIMVASYSGNLQAVKTLRLVDASYDL